MHFYNIKYTLISHMKKLVLDRVFLTFLKRFYMKIKTDHAHLKKANKFQLSKKVKQKTTKQQF